MGYVSAASEVVRNKILIRSTTITLKIAAAFERRLVNCIWVA